ncbi:MAG: sigma-54 dependent transcriptional regulator [Proteobacteria bacterium]|nr:sigma-54 dependent transcriptional regulator [Pseudomonadota bacterium]
MSRVLIIDDDDNLRTSFERLLSNEGYAVTTAPSAEAGIQIIRTALPDLVVLDMQMPGMNGLAAFKIIHKMEPKLPVIIMTAYGTTESAIETIKQGAFDYILKPFDIPSLLKVIGQAVDAGRFMRLPVKVDAGVSDGFSFEGESIVGRSPSMQEVYKVIGRVSASDATVLIRGDSGTGKELVARAIYQHSERAEKPFTVINCVAIPETLLESELFGYEKGAFTGANTRKIGKIEQANGGTVFLDEIGDMPSGLQSKILRLLQEKSIERIGGRETIPVDVRIIAATNRDLEAAMESGHFREDIYFRLKVVTVLLPPLRERAGDIPLLSRYFMGRYAKESQMANPGITEDALLSLDSYNWPGNVRELSNVIRKILIFNRGNPVSRDDVLKNTRLPDKKISSEQREESMTSWVRNRMAQGPEENFFDRCVDEFSALLVTEALKAADGNRSKAAKILGLSRPTLHAKIAKYEIEIGASVVKSS